MKQEQYKYIENKIRNAAEHYEPAFDENAWEKMEQILDAEKKPGRKPILWFWLLLPVLFCAIGLLLYTNHKQQAALTAANELIQKEKAALKEKPVSSDNTLAINQPAGTLGDVNTSSNTMNTPVVFDARISAQQGTDSSVGMHPQVVEPQCVNKGIHQHKAQKQSAKTVVQITNASSEQEIAASLADDEFNKKINQATATPEAASINAIQKDQEKKTAPAEANKMAESKSVNVKEKKKVLSKLYFLGSIGTENSGTKLMDFKSGKTMPEYSIAAGYNITRRLSVQAGISAGHKIYSAPGSAYNPKAGTYLSRVKIISLDADCMVYEIPVSVRYDFIQRKKMSYFAAAGVSSYIMKEEDYDYYYIRTGTYYEHPYSYSGNRHFLSVLNFSAGAERKLTDKIYVQVTPAVSVPVKGVGDGRVKLYSAGINLGVKYFPFRKK